MKYIIITFTVLTFLFISDAKAEAVNCETQDGAIICTDNYNYAYVFRANYPTVVANLTTGEYVLIGTTAGGNIYTDNPQQVPEKKLNFFDKLGKFGRALEEGFSQDNNRGPDTYRRDYDPLCVTQLQRRVNECDD